MIVQVSLALLFTMLVASALRAQTQTPVQYFYDDLGRLTRVVDTSGNIATYHYDAPMKGWQW